MDIPLGELPRTIKSEGHDSKHGLSSPRKRQCRGLKMEVCVPSLNLLRHERLKAEEDYKKLDKMRNVTLSHPFHFQEGESLICT